MRLKLDAKSYKAIFVGYPAGTKGYKVFNLETGKFAKTRVITVCKNVFHTFDSPPPKKDMITDAVFPFVNFEAVENSESIESHTFQDIINNTDDLGSTETSHSQPTNVIVTGNRESIETSGDTVVEILPVT